MITLEEAIAHFKGVAEFCRQTGRNDSDHEEIAGYLQQLRFYEIAIAEGELVWKKKRKPKKEETSNGCGDSKGV